MGVHLMGMYLTDVHLIGVYFIGGCFMGVYLVDVDLTGVHLMGCTSLRVPHWYARYGHAPHWHASHRRVYHGRQRDHGVERESSSHVCNTNCEGASAFGDFVIGTFCPNDPP